MAKFKFETKDGAYISGCQTDTEELAWQWISQVKQLTIKQVKGLYNIKKINNDD